MKPKADSFYPIVLAINRYGGHEKEFCETIDPL